MNIKEIIFNIKMFNRLRSLKDKGYKPDLIFDIGAEKGTWTDNVFSIYPTSQYYLCEAIDYKELDRFNKIYNIHVIKELLFNEEKEVDWHELRNTGDSIFKENTLYFKDCLPIKRTTQTLDNVTSLLNIENKSIFIKIDCQGSEIPILKGATNILSQTDFILLEIPLFGCYNKGVPNFLEHIKFMESIGFISYDIANALYIDGFCRQIDIIFISKKHPFNKLVDII